MAEENTQPNNSSEDKSKKNLYMWIAIAVIAGILILGVGVVFGTNNAVTAPIRALIIKPQPTQVPDNSDDMIQDEIEDNLEDEMEAELTEEPEPTEAMEPEVTEEPEPTEEPEITPQPTTP